MVKKASRAVNGFLATTACGKPPAYRACFQPPETTGRSRRRACAPAGANFGRQEAIGAGANGNWDEAGLSPPASYPVAAKPLFAITVARTVGKLLPGMGVLETFSVAQNAESPSIT